MILKQVMTLHNNNVKTRASFAIWQRCWYKVINPNEWQLFKYTPENLVHFRSWKIVKSEVTVMKDLTTLNESFFQTTVEKYWQDSCRCKFSCHAKNIHLSNTSSLDKLLRSSDSSRTWEEMNNISKVFKGSNLNQFPWKQMTRNTRQ